MPLGVLVARLVPPLQLWCARRLALWLVLVLLAADPSWRRSSRAMDLHVLLDRSASTEAWIDQGLPEWRQTLARARPSSGGELRFWNFAADVERESADQSGVFGGERHLTRLGLALQHVAAMASAQRGSRVLVMTDGYATEPLDQALNALRQRGIAVDFRLRSDSLGEDARVAEFSAPMKVQAREPVTLEIEVRAGSDGKKPVQLWRDDQLLGRAEVDVRQGVGKLVLADRLSQPGMHRYALALTDADAHLGNNRMERWVEVQGGAAVLWITRYQPDPAAQALRDRMVPVRVVTNGLELTATSLAGVRAVVINDVPAHLVASDFMKALPFFVEEQGGGLMMLGGEQSFGAGGYFESPIDPLLPVSMELKVEQRKLMVAMAVVLDRSGSMAVPVAPGVAKMDLANEGVATLIGLLGQMDQVSVHAVDTAAEVVVPLTSVGAAQQALMARVRRIRSAGGGIAVNEGLKAGWQVLQQAPWGKRHLILFADAADAEQPGNYRQILEQMTDQGATVSVIGLGTRGDQDAALLEEIAELGQGRAYFCENATDLPKFFAQETVAVARSAFLKNAVTLQETGRWREVADGTMAWPKQCDGYNLSYAREGSMVCLLSGDEYAAPLLATARRGLGRSVAVSFPLAGECSTTVRSWVQHGDLVLTLTRWLLGSDSPPGISFHQQLSGTELTVDLRYDADLWRSALSEGAPRLRAIGRAGQVREIPWQRLAPGHFQLRTEVDEGDVWRGVVQWAGRAWPMSPVVANQGREWAFDPRAQEELRHLAQATGGAELWDLRQAWRGTAVLQQQSWRPALLSFGLLLLLWDAASTRLGLEQVERSRLRGWRSWLRERMRRRRAGWRDPWKKKSMASSVAKSPSDASAGPSSVVDVAEQRQSRFQQAKRGGSLSDDSSRLQG